ncbi:MAG: N-acetyltransferase [Proteobacteria bacterium]|nr:MAG: N-acetyltransferase [Pseudomonadota bacterium]
MDSAIRTTRYQSKYLSDFIELNRQWITTYFAIEAMDIAQLEDAQKIILDVGGEIFFVLEDQRVLGTCAMVPHGPGCYELAKMAVHPAARGRGLGDVLMQLCISWARGKTAESIILLSNTILEPAIALYHKHGFQTTHLGPHPDYARCNIQMELILNR